MIIRVIVPQFLFTSNEISLVSDKHFRHIS